MVYFKIDEVNIWPFLDENDFADFSAIHTDTKLLHKPLRTLYRDKICVYDEHPSAGRDIQYLALDSQSSYFTSLCLIALRSSNFINQADI